MNQTLEKNIHQGRNVRRFREMRNLTQDGLAMALGEDWNQKKVSLLEAKEEIEPPVLEQVSKALKMPVEAFTNLDDDSAVNIISSTFNDHSVGYAKSYSPSFNPIDKVVQLYDEKIELYERMLKDKNELIEELKKARQ